MHHKKFQNFRSSISIKNKGVKYRKLGGNTKKIKNIY